MQRQREAQPVFITSVAPITRDDLELLKAPRHQTGTVQRLRESHRQVCRLAALGLTNVAIGEATGYSPTRVGQILNSPAATELVAVLQRNADQTTVDAMTEHASMIARRRTAAERHLVDYIDDLDEKDELLPPKLALALAADGADRTGYGKQSTVFKPNADFAAQLEKAIARSGKTLPVRRADNVIDLKPVPGVPNPPQLVERTAASVPPGPAPTIARRA